MVSDFSVSYKATLHRSITAGTLIHVEIFIAALSFLSPLYLGDMKWLNTKKTKQRHRSLRRREEIVNKAFMGNEGIKNVK